MNKILLSIQSFKLKIGSKKYREIKLTDKPAEVYLRWSKSTLERRFETFEDRN